MYELISKQIASDYFQQRFPNSGQRFVAWYLRNILFRDMNETRDDITDGGNDKQIDAIVIDDDKSLESFKENSQRAGPLMPNLYGKSCQRGFRSRTLRGFRTSRTKSCSANLQSWQRLWMKTTRFHLS